MYFFWRKLRKKSKNTSTSTSTVSTNSTISTSTTRWRDSSYGIDQIAFPGFYPLALAESVGNTNYTKLLYTRSDYVLYVDSTLLCPLSQCVITNDMDALKHIICERTKEPTQLQADVRGWTALHVAAFKDEYADCLELLLSNKDTLRLKLDAKTLTGKTALYLACYEGCPKNCRILLENQCNPEILADDYSLLHVATIRNHAGVVSQLIAHGLNSNCEDSKQNTPLHWACLNGNVEIVQLLMTSKQTQVNIFNDCGDLAFHNACLRGSVEIVRILLEADRSLVNRFSRYGLTPLMKTIEFRHVNSVDCVKYLLDHGADVNQCTNHHKTILYYAARSGIPKILELVLQATNIKYICEQFMLQITGFLSTHHYGGLDSLMTYVISSSSPECMLLLLKSSIPKGILETPYMYRQNNYVCDVFSPLSYLFQADRLDNCTLDQLLQLLLQYNITHLHEFSQMIELKDIGKIWSIHYVHPFTTIFEGPSYSQKRDQKSADPYLKKLLEYGITTDYCLQCDVHCKSRFLDFDMNFLERFYKPVVWAVKEDNAEFIELLLIHSAILEPSHLWDFLQYRRSSVKGRKENPQNVVNYLLDLGGILNTSNLPLYPFVGIVKCPNLQQLCRQVIRKHLRDVTMQDNLKNFKQKIDALPLPNLLKDYLNFKGR